MTEYEWLSGSYEGYREAVRSLGDRRMRLLATACCRLLVPWADEPVLADALAVADRFADGEATAAALDHAGEAVRRVRAEPSLDILRQALRSLDPDRPRIFAEHRRARERDRAVVVILEPLRESMRAAAVSEVEAVLRTDSNAMSAGRRTYNFYLDIAGPPGWQPSSFAAGWRTGTAAALAAQMYASRDFAATPIMADALQDAGCDDDRVLTHLRGPWPHARGCWAIDAVLGKG